MRFKVTSVADIDDYNYYGFVCVTVGTTMQAGDRGIGIVTKDLESVHELQEVTVVEATSTTSVIAVPSDENGWSITSSSATGGGLSTSFDFTIYAENEQDNVGVDTSSEAMVQCFISAVSASAISFNNEINMSDWYTAEA